MSEKKRLKFSAFRKEKLTAKVFMKFLTVFSFLASPNYILRKLRRKCDIFNLDKNFAFQKTSTETKNESRK